MTILIKVKLGGLAIAAFLFCVPVDAAETHMGVASVVDGDTIEIHGERIRFHGIDAMEGRQLCADRSGSHWRCGAAAANALAELVGRKAVECRAIDRDRYGRVVAVCFVGSLNINAWMVSEGWACSLPPLLAGV